MESLEATAGVKSSVEGQDRNVAQKKCTSEAAQTKRSPSVESEGTGWHQQLQEDQSRDTSGFIEMSDSGKSLQLEDQHSQIQSTIHPDHEGSTYPGQSTKQFPSGRQKALCQLGSAQSPGPASHMKSTSSPEVQQQCSHSGMDQLSETVSKVEQKPQKPGKYVCDYCGRACAKPSVLKKHIRSHTGERPYPCVPCGFSFKTKSNLYKHRKSHAHSVKAGTVPLSELGSYNANTDQGSFEGEGELFSDAEQSTDTDEDTLNDPLLLLDSPVEGSDNTAVKVLNLIAQKKGATSMSAQDGSSQTPEINAPPAASEASRAIQSCTIKQRLALRLSEKRSSDSEHNLSLPSQSSKGSTDSGYFSRSESTEHQTGPPNTNAKTYQEIMFGKCYRPSPKQTAAFVACSTDSSEYTTKRAEKGVSRVFTQEKDTVESIKINTKSFTREELKEPQLDAGSDVGLLIRSNSMPAASAVCLTMPQALRGSHSFDERTSTGGNRRLRRQAAFEHSAHEGHTDTDSHGKMGESGNAPHGLEMESYPSMATNMSHQRHAMELATRKRRKEKREEEELAGQYEVHHECEEMFDLSKDYDSKQPAAGITALGKGRSSSMLTQVDRCDMDISVSLEMSGRKTLGNVISVIQHTNSINRPLSEQTESYKYQGQRQESISSFQAMEASESYELERTDSSLRQSFQIGPKLVRQPNIQVPEIRVTVEPDSPEKAPEVQVKEPEKHVEEFQWPQRSETLAQFPPEKLPPKKKRLRLADIEHSSGESSFESACTSLSRSPSQDSNLSYSSTFSFDREESLKSVSPARQDEFGKPLELLAVPGSGHSLSVLNQRQQHEMRRSSSEQAPCNLRKEFPEVRSISFDYGSLSPTSKVRHVDISVGHSAVRERRRGNLVRQESLNMDTEVTQVPSQVFPQHFCSTSPPFTAVAVLPQTLPIFSTGNTFPQLSHPSLLVPVRIQTHVPSFGSITYTSVSQIIDNQYEGVCSLTSTPQNQTARLSGNLDSHTRPSSMQNLTVEALDLSSAKLKTGIPLSLTSRTISTTNASSGGANKRMLSPASSLDLFIEVKQQKRVKEERMFGQIVEELSAVELGKCNLSEERGQRSEKQGASTPHAQDDSHRSKFITLQQKVTEPTDHGLESTMESSSLETGSPSYMMSASEVKEVGMEKQVQMDTMAQLVTSPDILISDTEHSRLLSQFPSLRTTTGVSWCYLNYTKPSCSHTNAPFFSVYATWCVSSHNPNPLELTTNAALALLRSKQRGEKVIYTVAAMSQAGTGKLVSSLILWRQTMEQLQRKPEPKEVDITYGKKVKDTSSRVKTTKEEWKEREASTTQTVPTRIKIFEGGFKSNEDYVYVRGRGRGKYICEECGIRCKKPSMLKKHIRTHTDVRPYICRVCNFAFKTKGNLTKHMKSKAHMKKCLELGVSVTLDDTEIQEHVDDNQQESKTEVVVPTKHQFSDAEDSDGMDEEADDIDEEDDEDDDYEGDSTPKLRSRSTSPQPCGVTSLSVTATAAIHGCSLTSLPDPDLRQQSSSMRTGPMLATDQREKSMDEDSLALLSPDHASFLFDPYSSCLLSPGWESPIREPSPSRLRYPSPRREISPRGRSSPRWDTSSLRPGSPSLTAIQHLSPASIERPMSPGTELAGKSSVRGRQRVVLRAVSPRRGSHQHRGSSDKTRHQTKMEMAQHQVALEMEMDQRSSLASTLPGAASSHHQNILSHLPLHSQQQAQSLLPIAPVGGLQMLHSPPSSTTDVTPSLVPRPQSNEGQRCSSMEGSVHGLETGGEDIRGQDQLAAQEKTLDLSVGDSGQEENVQTCLKAIASLKITTEDPH
ncbi:transcription factor HIVEP2-like isoform X1 [Notolabrus celidotus]|uniref:transcription factor HIVEP2-like isoform X1 n=1 Tax=Notolabrus celidotus TaxID=1203425 RepID=UPI00148FF9C2|nr:transcription factor HIVEP2-like isoform X1 [Notolabrus celidotus]XP_034530176.1 transcription factor HIVEP2-like isoform X1 [Notolabrus celidotus]XP_034530177.1 transcription factor HIVEP2-like isoform X1 [Notolabrus celidotus]XP_034530178.1 transcription factor HIVEP2-like isoform X1 [Notolabrus celidotus]